jgi:two-component system, cell cycle response regulator CpdR
MKKIVFADDCAGQRRHAQIVLSDLGYQVILAADGRQALDAIHREDGLVDLLITDVNMPYLNGTALVNALGQEGKSIPIIVYSGMPFARENYTYSGLIVHIQKSLSVDILYEKAVEILGVASQDLARSV